MATKTADQLKQESLLNSAKSKLAAQSDQTKALASLSGDEKNALKREYGYAYALITSDPGLMAAFTKAVSTGMTAAGFQQELMNTAWYTSRTASQRQYDALNKDATAKTDLDALRTKVSDEIKRMAIAANNVQVSDADALDLANSILRDHYTDWQEVLPRVVGSTYVTDDVLSFGGAAATSAQEIRTLSAKMGITLSDATIGRYVDDIASGKNTIENITSVIRNMSLSMYPQFAENIKNGGTIEDVLGTYKNVASNLLEISPDQLNVLGVGNTSSDPLLLKALFGKDGKAMSITDFRKEIKKDARWQKTSNARDEYATTAKNIMRSFGVNF